MRRLLGIVLIFGSLIGISTGAALALPADIDTVCANNREGTIRYVSAAHHCRSFETVIDLDAGATELCENNVTGVLRASDHCRSFETGSVVPGPTLDACVNSRTGVVRVSPYCRSFEFAGVIAP